MTRLLALLIITISFAVLFRGRWLWSVYKGKKGFSPRDGKPTMFHVRDLIKRGETDLAISMYCEIFQTNRHEATKAVAELQTSIQGNNP